jgi:general secretion pathway protein F
METATLDDLMALNEQLAALAEAGVPLAASAEESDLPRTLESVNAVVARRVSRGAELEDALEREPAVPMWYRCVVLLGLRSRNMEATLEASNRVAQSIEETRHTTASAFFYPLVICALAYVGMICFSLFYVPMLERTCHGLQVEAGWGLTALQFVRDALPYWVAAPLVLLLLWILWRVGRGSGGRAGAAMLWLPAMSRSVKEARWASFAETLSVLEGSRIPVEESLPLAACAVGDAHIAEAGRLLADRMVETSARSDDIPAAKRFPPFLRWAILHSEATIGRARALEMAARLYRQAAERSAERSRIVAPMFVCVILGGGVTLLYALAVFLPVVELLRALARP